MRSPSQVDGLVGHAKRVVAVDAEQGANIVVKMSGLTAMGGDPVDVYVKDPIGDRSNALDAGFLSGLAECHVQDVRIAVGVTAKLKPEPKLPVVCQQDMRAGRIDDPAGAGDVSFPERSFKTVGMRLHKRKDPLTSFLFDVVARFVRSKLVE